MLSNYNTAFSYDIQRGVAENIAMAIMIDAGIQWCKHSEKEADIFVNRSGSNVFIRIPLTWKHLDMEHVNVFVLKAILKNKKKFDGLFSKESWESLIAVFNKAEQHLGLKSSD